MTDGKHFVAWPIVYETKDLSTAPDGIEYETSNLGNGPTIHDTRIFEGRETQHHG